MCLTQRQLEEWREMLKNVQWSEEIEEGRNHKLPGLQSGGLGSSEDSGHLQLHSILNKEEGQGTKRRLVTAISTQPWTTACPKCLLWGCTVMQYHGVYVAQLFTADYVNLVLLIVELGKMQSMYTIYFGISALRLQGKRAWRGAALLASTATSAVNVRLWCRIWPLASKSI